MRYQRTIHRPANSVKVTCKKSGAFVFIYEHKGEPCAIGHLPKAKANSAFWTRFRTAERRAQAVAEFFKACADRAERTAQRRAERNRPHNLQVGHVLRTCWGYEQTNVEFFQVTRIVGPNTVELREMAQMTQETGFMSGHTLPRLDAFAGEAFVRRVSMEGKDPSVTIDQVRTAWLWNGKAASCSWYA